MQTLTKKMLSLFTIGALFLVSATPSAFAWGGQFMGNTVGENFMMNGSFCSHSMNFLHNLNNFDFNRLFRFNRANDFVFCVPPFNHQHVFFNRFGSNFFIPNNGFGISGNGAFSRNRIFLNSRNSLDVNQNNFSDFNNNVDVNQSTGNNSASFNTGGDVSIETGNASSTVEIHNMGGSNELSL